MDQTISDLRHFAHSFFSNLGCTVVWEGDELLVSALPEAFETSYGKRGPYRLLFDAQEGPGELVARGSFLLKTMMAYLEERGQTALVKLVFDQDYAAAFKRSFAFKKCELSSLSKTARYQPLYLFSFSTTLQYLNEKEQVMNTLAVHEGKIIPFSLEQFAHEPGDPREVVLSDLKEAYAQAKTALRERIESRVNDVSHTLNERMVQEIARIRNHYDHQLNERSETIRKIKEQLSTMEKASPLTATMIQRRDRLLETLKTLEHPDFESKVVRERDFVVRDEEFKHSLNLSTKLVSTTVAYYPLLSFNLILKNADVTRAFSVVYNPLKNDFETPVVCEHCTHPLRELWLCSSSHVVCANCFDSCRSCDRGICALCVKKTCVQCARKLCKRCVARCTLCWKDVCKSHLRINYATGAEGCTSCLRACSRCGAFADKSHVSRDLDGSEVCAKCASLAKISFARRS